MCRLLPPFHFYCICKEAALLRIWLHIIMLWSANICGLLALCTCNTYRSEVGNLNFDRRLWLERSIISSFFQGLLWEVIYTCVCSTIQYSTQLIVFGYFSNNRLLRSTFTILNPPTQEKIGAGEQRSSWHYWVNNKCNSHLACLSCYCFAVCFWLPFR